MSKRSTSPPNKTRTKRARKTIDPSETQQVTQLDRSKYRLPLVDADVYYVDDFVDEETAQRWHDELLKVEGWYQPTLKMYGKEITQSRQIAAYATSPTLTVKYSGTLVNMSYDYPPLLLEIQTMVESRLGVKFNHCMMNRYEDGKVYIGNHRDNKENRVIASLSLGSPRTFIMEHDQPPKDAPSHTTKPIATRKTKTTSSLMERKTIEEEEDRNLNPPQEEGLYYKRWILKNGSLVVMQGDTQSRWKHQIPKETKVKESRISLTFRQLVF